MILSLPVLAALIAVVASQNSSSLVTDANVQTSLAGCRSLAKAYPQLTFFPETTEYKARIVENWSETCIEQSTCTFEPNNAEQVAGAIKILVRTATKFAVRGGGHMPNPGAAGIENGVLFSLNNMNQTKLVKNKSIAQLGPGLRWGAVYDWISPYGLAVVGGRYSPVGVPGLLLGGGINFFGSQYGWATSMISNMQVVLADGSIVDASLKSNPDLFWALKGGSSNFGIVTRFDLKTFPLNDIYGGFTLYNTSYIDEFLNATGHYSVASGGSSDSKTSVNPSISYLVSAGELQLFTLISHVGNDPSPASVANYTKIPSTLNDNSVRMKINMFTNETAGAAYSDRSGRQMFRATALKAGPESVALSSDAFFSTIDSMPALKNVTGIKLTSTHQTITSVWLDNARKSGGDTMDLDPKNGNFISYLISSAWEDEKDDDLIEKFNTKCIAAIERQAKAKGLFYEFYYLNDSPTEVRVFESYGTGQSSLRKMRKIAKTYDPNGVFQQLLPGGFKLFY